jgi:hypothetical protein
MKKIKILIAILALFIISAKTYAQVSVEITASIAPPPLVVYSQPPCPEDGYIWTPGYWAYGDDGYYWVPGVWVSPPEPDYYWTPCYWGFDNGIYGWHSGYWGPSIGFYGGVDYGYGYGGYGYAGGRWEGGHFRYNTAVTNVNRGQVRNVYVDRSVANTRQMRTRTSFNGPGGITRQPRAEERTAMSQPHTNFTHEQETHQQAASQNRNQFASVNHGKPAVASMNKVGGSRFNTQGHAAVAPARGAGAARPAGVAAHTQAIHPQGQRNTHSQQRAMQPHTQAPMHTAPQQHIQQSHPQTQQHMQTQSHPQQQTRPQPQMQHTQQPQVQHEQPHPQPQQQMHEAPQQHSAPMESHPAPMGGGGGGEHGGGGERGGGRR